MSGLLVHAGSRLVTVADLAAVPVPEPTPSYHPVPYGRFVEEVELHIPRFGLTVRSREFALGRDGAQMFGVLTCANGHQEDYGLAIGLRNSYDRSLAVGLVAGSHVFCCDNLAFSGEVAMARKHTVHVFRDLPDLIYRMLSEVSTMQGRMDAEIRAMKGQVLDNPRVAELLVAACRRNVIAFSQMPKVIEAWEEPVIQDFRPRTAWSLFNAFTGYLAGRSLRARMEDSLRLTKVFREVLRL